MFYSYFEQSFLPLTSVEDHFRTFCKLPERLKRYNKTVPEALGACQALQANC